MFGPAATTVICADPSGGITAVAETTRSGLTTARKETTTVPVIWQGPENVMLTPATMHETRGMTRYTRSPVGFELAKPCHATTSFQRG